MNHLFNRVFAERRNSGDTDLEAVESALRTALHQAGAAALSELLKFDGPAPDQRQLPCPRGHQAQYRELRSRPVLTVLGWSRINRPWYLCEHCHEGQFPADEAMSHTPQIPRGEWGHHPATTLPVPGKIAPSLHAL